MAQKDAFSYLALMILSVSPRKLQFPASTGATTKNEWPAMYALRSGVAGIVNGSSERICHMGRESRSRPCHASEKTAGLLSFPYVCHEPVLAK